MKNIFKLHQLLCVFILITFSCSSKKEEIPEIKIIEVIEPQVEQIEPINIESCDSLIDPIINISQFVKKKNINDIIELSTTNFDIITRLKQDNDLRASCIAAYTLLSEENLTKQYDYDNAALFIKKINIYKFTSVITYFDLSDKTDIAAKHIIKDPQVGGNNYFSLSNIQRDKKEISMELLIKQDFTKIYGAIIKNIHLENQKHHLFPLIDQTNKQIRSQVYGFMEKNQWHKINLYFLIEEKKKNKDYILTFNINNTVIAINLE